MAGFLACSVSDQKMDITVREFASPKLSAVERQRIVDAICQAMEDLDPLQTGIDYRTATISERDREWISWHIFSFNRTEGQFTINVDPKDLRRFEAEWVQHLRLVVVFEMTPKVAKLLYGFDLISTHELAALCHRA